MENGIHDLQDQDWFVRIMKSEGGLNRKEPASVGGISYAGITQATYAEWLEHTKPELIVGFPSRVEMLAGSVEGSEWEKASPLEIPSEFNVRLDIILAFYKDYFFMARLEVLPECLRYMHADFYVNSQYTANKLLQEMVGLTGKEVDGVLGPVSRERIAEMEDHADADDLIMEYHDRKLRHYASIEGTNKELYLENIKGWRRRAQHVLGELEHYFRDDEPTTSAVFGDEPPAKMFLPVEEEQNETTPVVESEIEFEPGRNPKFSEWDDEGLVIAIGEMFVELNVRHGLLEMINEKILGEGDN